MSKVLTHWGPGIIGSVCRCSECGTEYRPSILKDFYVRTLPVAGQPLVCQRCILGLPLTKDS